jgi:hypothetical protein
MFNPMKSLAVVALAALSLIVVVSCGDDDESSLCKGDESFIVALSLESVWIYRVTDYDTADAVIRTFNDTVMITDAITVESDPWYETSIEDELWVNRADGFWVWKDHDDDISEPYLLIKHPAALGQKYVIPFEDIHPDTMTVADAMALVTVPYGSFTATTYQLKSYDGTVMSLSYYVRGIGKVKEIMIPDRETKLIRRVIELQRFSTTGC